MTAKLDFIRHTVKLPMLAIGSLSLALAWPFPAVAEEAAAGKTVVDDAAVVSDAALEGRVVSTEAADETLDDATVYAYDLGSYRFQKVLTDKAGRFLFRTLPAGMYKVIAVKKGFVPAVEILERWNAGARQRLDLRLNPESTEPRDAESYWTVRQRIPPDVLRDVATALVELRTAEAQQPSESIDVVSGSDARFQASMAALGGTTDVRDGYAAQLSGADVGVRGSVGAVEVGVQGRYQQLQPTRLETTGGELQSVAVRVGAPGANELRVQTASAAMSGLRDGQLVPVDVEQHQLQWRGRAGETSRVGVDARYLEESGFYQPGFFELTQLPDASRTLDLHGYYTRELGATTSIEAGVEYRERSDSSLGGLIGEDGLLEESVGLYGVAGTRIQPRVLVEIGLYSEMREGGMSLMPRSSFVVDLGKDWRARTSVAHRLQEDDSNALPHTFDSAIYSDDSACERASEACYSVFFTRGEEGDDSRIALGAVHREFAETLRVYFSEDFFRRLESLFMIPGDAVPEIQLSVARRIAPRVLARLESNFASGGGGVFYATDQAYENQIRYLVTSLDTHFQQTATGVFIAFHHLEQAFDPIDAERPRASARDQVELERLQLMLTQDLSALVDLSANWAVRVNMELSRGNTPYTLTEDVDELYKTLTGGFSVSF